MPFEIVILALAAHAAQPEPITVVAQRWAPFISPMGEPFRSKAAGDDTLVNWFAQADRDRDGAMTAAEMRIDAERFFALLDRDADGEIHPGEIVEYEWEMAPEVQVNAQRRLARGETAPAADKPDRRGGRRGVRPAYDPYGLQGAARYALLNLPQPVAAADSDLDRAITLDEFRKAAATRFGLLDRAGDQRLSLPDLRALVPSPAELARRSRPKKGERDTRVAVPVPIGD